MGEGHLSVPLEWLVMNTVLVFYDAIVSVAALALSLSVLANPFTLLPVYVSLGVFDEGGLKMLTVLGTGASVQLLGILAVSAAINLLHRTSEVCHAVSEEADSPWYYSVLSVAPYHFTSVANLLPALLLSGFNDPSILAPLLLAPLLGSLVCSFWTPGTTLRYRLGVTVLSGFLGLFPWLLVVERLGRNLLYQPVSQYPPNFHIVFAYAVFNACLTVLNVTPTLWPAHHWTLWMRSAVVWLQEVSLLSMCTYFLVLQEPLAVGWSGE